MAASEHLHPSEFGEQLDMLRPAHELMSIPGDFPASRAAQGWDRKLSESKMPMDVAYQMGRKKKSKEPSLHDSIRQTGVRWPVSLKQRDGKSIINDGHHRIAAANDIDRNMLIPVTHS